MLIYLNIGVVVAHETQVRGIAENAIVAALALKLEVWLLHHTLHEKMDDLVQAREQLVAAPLLVLGS